jgi:RNA polymerase sigma-70 factor (ECF subfamily)
VQRGEREAFAELYRAFAPRLYSQVLMPKLGNAHAAEDALSETFSALLEHAARLDVGERSVFHWLARVASNKAIDMHRKKARTRRSLASFESLLAPLLEPVDPLAEGEHQATRLRAQKTVGQVLDALNPRYRRALELRFLQEQSRERCAEVMELKLGTFDVLLLRALRAFRKQWEALVTP